MTRLGMTFSVLRRLIVIFEYYQETLSSYTFEHLLLKFILNGKIE